MRRVTRATWHERLQMHSLDIKKNRYGRETFSILIMPYASYWISKPTRPTLKLTNELSRFMQTSVSTSERNGAHNSSNSHTTSSCEHTLKSNWKEIQNVANDSL